jgi:N-acetylglucosaminyldiphosphoundecaprenol N-acetyl-beta-D-mannosaminyltransferase
MSNVLADPGQSISAAWPPRVQLFGIRLNPVTMAEAVSIIDGWVRDGLEDGEACHYVTTPNVDHMVLLRDHAEMRAAYAGAGLVLADGWPVVTASRWLGVPLPERVAGSDLVPALFSAADPHRPLRTYLLGAAPGVAFRAAQKIHDRWPGVQVVGVDSPPLGFERDAELNARILSRIASVQPDLLVVGLGAPKQELWVHKHRHSIESTVAICAGATIDFLAGERRRAPVWMQRLGLEWLHRVASEPRRLVRRYARDAAIFPQLVLKEYWRHRRLR